MSRPILAVSSLQNFVWATWEDGALHVDYIPYRLIPTYWHDQRDELDRLDADLAKIRRTIAWALERNAYLTVMHYPRIAARDASATTRTQRHIYTAEFFVPLRSRVQEANRLRMYDAKRAVAKKSSTLSEWSTALRERGYDLPQVPSGVIVQTRQIISAIHWTRARYGLLSPAIQPPTVTAGESLELCG